MILSKASCRITSGKTSSEEHHPIKRQHNSHLYQNKMINNWFILWKMKRKQSTFECVRFKSSEIHSDIFRYIWATTRAQTISLWTIWNISPISTGFPAQDWCFNQKSTKDENFVTNLNQASRFLKPWITTKMSAEEFITRQSRNSISECSRLPFSESIMHTWSRWRVSWN